MCLQLSIIDPGSVFRQLDELTPLDEQVPHSVMLTLLQTAVRSVPEPRIIETMEEYMSSTNSHSLTIQ